VAERLSRQRATEDGSPAEIAGQISARDVTDEISHAGKERVLPVQEDESATAHEMVGWLQEVFTHRQAKTSILTDFTVCYKSA